MANIKDLKKRIKSTKSTLKITSAMKLVSAAKLSKAQSRIQGFKPYSNELEQTVKLASALAENYKHQYLEEKEDGKKEILLVISSNKGLCGGYNSQLYKKVKAFLPTKEDVDVYFIGRKVEELLKRDSVFGVKKFAYEKNDPEYSEAREIIEELAQKFINGEVSKIHVAYNSFISAIEFEPRVQQVLPVSLSESEKEALLKEFPVDFLYEPGATEILDELIPEVLNTSVFTYMLDAIAAEHATRMTAMDNATKNSKEMIRNLTLTMNKLRQAAITTELTEIVSGAESLNA